MPGQLTLSRELAESAILSDKQIRHESRLTLVDLNLKNGVYRCLSAVEIKINPSDVHLFTHVHSCFK